MMTINYPYYLCIFLFFLHTDKLVIFLILLCHITWSLFSKIVIPARIHIRLSCLTPFGLMQICSRQICAGIQTTWKYLSSPSLTTTLRTGHGNRYPLPGGYDELPVYFYCSHALRGNAARDALRLAPLERYRIHSHAGAWERCQNLIHILIDFFCKARGTDG